MEEPRERNGEREGERGVESRDRRMGGVVGPLGEL